MMREGYLRAGHGIYEAQTRVITTASGKQIRRRIGGKGIDAIYRRFGTEGDLAILESKWRRKFSMGRNPETILGLGIKLRDDARQYYVRQMSPGWIDEVIARLRRSDVAGARRASQLLGAHGYRNRFINVLNGQGESMIYLMP